jgi:hypothetical protein
MNNHISTYLPLPILEIISVRLTLRQLLRFTATCRYLHKQTPSLVDKWLTVWCKNHTNGQKIRGLKGESFDYLDRTSFELIVGPWEKDTVKLKIGYRKMDDRYIVFQRGVSRYKKIIWTEDKWIFESILDMIKHVSFVRNSTTYCWRDYSLFRLTIFNQPAIFDPDWWISK